MRNSKLKIGDRIPVFELINERNMLIRISPKDNKRRILFFYPKDETRVCTEQACSFRDEYSELLELGYEVIGISGDTPSAHEKFIANHNLNFTLLSDKGGEVRKLFGATKLLGLIPWRKTFVIDENGRMIFEYEAMFEAQEHIHQVKQFIKNTK